MIMNTRSLLGMVLMSGCAVRQAPDAPTRAPLVTAEFTGSSAPLDVQLEGYVMAHQHAGYRTLTKDAKGESPGIITMMNKIISTNIGHDVSRLAMDLLGDNGLLGAGSRSMTGMMGGAQGWIAQYMYSLGIAVAGGTANIQRNVIGERGLGLPRDAAAERSSGK